jgi:hypothetical protein
LGDDAGGRAVALAMKEAANQAASGFLQTARLSISMHRNFLRDTVSCMRVRMEFTFLFFTALLLLFMPPAFGQVPKLNVKAFCNGRAADAKILQSIPEQSIADCVREEEDNKQKLSSRWTSTSIPLRTLCESDARALGTMSYLDLFICIEMGDDLRLYRKELTRK